MEGKRERGYEDREGVYALRGGGGGSSVCIRTSRMTRKPCEVNIAHVYNQIIFAFGSCEFAFRNFFFKKNR